MSRGRIVIQLGLAITLAVGAGWLVLGMMSNQRPATVAEAPPTTPVVVAASILAPGDILELANLRIAQFPAESVPEGGYGDPAELEGQVVLSPMGVNEPVTTGRVADANSGVGGISALVEPGKRAVAVQGNRVMGLAGLIRPGNKVDVLVTIDTKQGRVPRTKIVLANIPVIATGERLVPSPDGRETAPVDIYTLSVTPEEAERLSLAATRGVLHFALRGAGDEEAVLTEGASIASTLASYAKGRGPSRSAPSHTVEVITGSQKSRVKF